MLFKVLLITLCVHLGCESCSALPKNDTGVMKRLLRAFKLGEKWWELSEDEKMFAFILASKKLEELETMIIEVDVVEHILRLMEGFIDENCRFVDSIRNAAKAILDPEEKYVPVRLISERNQAKSLRKRAEKQNYINVFFNSIYRQMMAILQAVESGNLENLNVKFFYGMLKEEQMDIERAALAAAELYSELARFSLNKPNRNRVNWNQENKVVEALKKTYKIEKEDVIKVARIFQRMKTSFLINSNFL